MMVMVVGSAFFITVHRKGTFLLDKSRRLSKDVMKKANRDSNRLFGCKIASLLVALSSGAAFFLTEDISSVTFRLYNSWSIFHIALLLLFGLLVFLGLKGLEDIVPQKGSDDPAGG